VATWLFADAERTEESAPSKPNFEADAGRLAAFPMLLPIPTKPPVCNGMIAPKDSWMMPSPMTR
jgi:hypothetical protein